MRAARVGRSRLRREPCNRRDVVGGRAAAAADDCRAGGDEMSHVRGEFVGPDGEDGLPVHNLRHAGVGLDDDWLRGDFRQPFDEREHAVGAESAVEPVGVRAKSLEKFRDAFDRRAREEFAVLAERNGRPDGKGRILLRREHGGLQFARIAHRLDDDEIRTRRRAKADLLRERRVGILEVEVARRLQEPSRRADVECDLLRSALPRKADGGGNQVLKRVFAVVFQSVRAEGVGHYDMRPRRDVGAVNRRDG